MPTPLIENNAFTAQAASAVPSVTGNEPAISAHRSNQEDGACLRAPIKIVPLGKQITGLTMTVSIQNNGVADQSVLEAPVA